MPFLIQIIQTIIRYVRRIEEYLNVEPDLVFLVLQPLDINFLKISIENPMILLKKKPKCNFTIGLMMNLKNLQKLYQNLAEFSQKRDEPLFVKNGEYGNVSNIDNQEFRDSISRLVQSQREKAFLIVDTDKIFAESGLEKPESVVIDLGMEVRLYLILHLFMAKLMELL